MNYIAYLSLNRLPYVEEEIRLVNGEEQVCLIIPTKINQLKKGKTGNWLITLRLSEKPPNEELITHTVQLGYLNWDEVDKARQTGYYNQTQRMGRVRVHDRTPSKKVNRVNNASDIECCGTIILSDIPKCLIFRNGENDKRYVKLVKLQSVTDDTIVYLGTICVDDIPRDAIQTESCTGKKFINTFFCKLERLDAYMNTHKLVIVRKEGAEIEIGRFREFRKDGGSGPILQQERISTANPQPPEEINGIRF